MRIGLFGGSFNPIHLGHLRSAEEVREALNLDLVYFIPAAAPPHKQESELTPPDHRLSMVRAATKGNRYFMVSDVEIRRLGRSYSVDTVRYFLSTVRQPATLFLMMGADAFAELDTWKDATELIGMCNVVVHTRQAAGDNAAQKISLAAMNR